jgi:transposase
MAVNSQGIVHYEIQDRNCKKPDFVKFIRNIPNVFGKTLVMDNIKFHHSIETREAMNDVGAKALYIPPYSPRFNAIEYTFSTLKRSYRKLCTTTWADTPPTSADDYVDLLIALLETGNDYQGFFRRVRNTVNKFNIDGIISRYD